MNLHSRTNPGHDLLIDVEDGRIVIVARRPTAFIGSPEMLDLGDVTLLPGLIDIHQHLAFDLGRSRGPPVRCQ